MNSKKSNGIIILLLSVLILSLLSCASTAPLPSTLNIVPPSKDLSKEIAAFSGIWEGKWMGWFDIALVVEKIDSQKADVIVSNGDNEGIVGAYYYHTGDVIENPPSIEWIEPNGNKMIFIMDKGLNKINAYAIIKETGSKRSGYLNRKK